MNAEFLGQMLSDLTSKQEDVKFKSCQYLQNYIQTELRELSQEDAGIALDFIADRLKTFLLSGNDDKKSMNSDEKKGALMAIDILIDADVNVVSNTRLLKLMGDLDALLLSITSPGGLGSSKGELEQEVLEPLAKTIGKMVLASVSMTTERLETEVRTSFEFLADGKCEWRRYAAVSYYQLSLLLPTMMMMMMMMTILLSNVIYNDTSKLSVVDPNYSSPVPRSFLGTHPEGTGYSPADVVLSARVPVFWAHFPRTPRLQGAWILWSTC